MKSLKLARSAGSIVALLFLLGGAGSHARMPDGEYACQVVAEGGRIGLVLVQADSRELAEKAAVGAQAMTYDKIPSRAIEVTQCIDRRSEERFQDYQFQAFFENVPL